MSKPRDGLNALPAELLCEIFWLAIHGGQTKESRCTLMLVCRQWREYVEGSALLWTDICAFDGLATMRRALERSKGAMLNLRYRLHWGTFVSLEAFMAEVGPHIARWRMLVVWPERSRPSPAENQLAPLTTKQAPSLEILRLFSNSRYHSVSRNAITLFGGAPAPSTLKELTLERIAVAIEPLKLSGLVSLDLTRMPTITTPQLLEILRRSPSLETLRLKGNAGLVAIAGSEASNIQPIELPKLDYLSLTSTDHNGAYCILSNIRIPNRRSVLIRGDASWGDATSAFFTSAIAHLLHTTISTADVRSLVISVEGPSRGVFTIKFRGIEIQLLMYGEDRLQEILRWLADGLGSGAAECPVHVILDGSDGGLIPLAMVPPPLTVKHLSISDTMLESLRQDLYIAMVRPSDRTPPGWLYPQLESLSALFESMEPQEQFVSMLRSRYGGVTVPGETESRCPVGLQFVKLRGNPRTEGLVEEIKRILGEASVFWADEETP